MNIKIETYSSCLEIIPVTLSLRIYLTDSENLLQTDKNIGRHIALDEDSREKERSRRPTTEMTVHRPL